MRKTVPLARVVPTLRVDSSAWPLLFTGNPSVVHTTHEVAPGRPEIVFEHTSSILTIALPFASCPVTTRRTLSAIVPLLSPLLSRGSDRLKNFVPGQLGRQDLAPVGLTRDHALGGAQRGVGRPGAARHLPGGHRLDRLQEEPARLDDRLVGRPQVLPAAVDDGPHAFLDGAVLGVDPVDP